MALLTSMVSCAIAEEDPAVLSGVFGRLNTDFKGFISSLEAQDKKGNVVYKFAPPPEGIESDSKQYIHGVFIMIDAKGAIERVKPVLSPFRLPDQKTVNDSVDSGVGLGKYLEKYEIEKVGDVDVYGLLNKWATAVLVRKNAALPKLDLSPKQLEIMEALFKGTVKIPSGKDSEAVDKIENFAKEVIRYSPY